MVVNNAVSALIREAKTVQIASIMQTGKALGNRLLNDELSRLVNNRQVDYAEAYLKAVDKADLQQRLGQGRRHHREADDDG